MRGSRSELAQLPEDSCEPDMEIGLARQRRCGVLLSDPEVMLEERAGPVRATEPDEHGADGDGGRQGVGDVPCRLESCAGLVESRSGVAQLAAEPVGEPEEAGR